MKKKLPLLVNVSLLYLIAWSISPPLSIGTGLRVVVFGATLYLYVWCALKNSISLDKVIITSFLCVLYIMMVCWFTNESFINKIQFFIFLSMVVLLWTIHRHICSEIDLMYLVTFTIALYILWNTTSIVGLSHTPNAMRLLAKSNENTDALLKQGIGGFGYVYSVILLLPIVFGILTNKTSKRYEKLLAVLFIVTSYILLYQSQYFLALILGIITPVLLLVHRVKNTNVKVFLVFFVFIGLLFLFLFAGNVIQYLRSINTYRKLDEKLAGMYDLLYSDIGIQNTDFGTRYERYQRSFNTFLEHPIFGSWYIYTVGHHSFILDTFAQFGIICGSGVLFSVICPLKQLGILKNKYALTSFVLLIILLLMNQAALVFGLVMYFVIPCYHYSTLERESRINNEEDYVYSPLRNSRWSGS